MFNIFDISLTIKKPLFPKVGFLDDLAVVIGIVRSFFSDIDQQQNEWSRTRD